MDHYASIYSIGNQIDFYAVYLLENVFFQDLFGSSVTHNLAFI